MENQKIYAMSFGKIYPLLVAKAERKGRTLEEVEEIIYKLIDELAKGKVMDKILRG